MTEARPENAPPLDKGSRRLTWVAIGLAAIGLLLATLGNDLRVQDVDPQFTRVVVERTEAFGGTFYENGIYNKGPLELVVHRTASLVMTDAGYWFAIASIAALISLALAAIATRTARIGGAPRGVAIAAGAAAFVGFTYSDADYAGVIFVRNLTVALLAISWIILASEAAWTTARRRLWSVVAITASVGLAVQTLLTTALAGGVILVGTYRVLRRQAPDWERIKLVGIGFLTLDAAILSAPVWYWARGAFDEFWASWWVHARFMSDAIDQGTLSRLWLGLQEILAYHRERPLVLAVVVVFLVVTVRRWRTWPPSTRIVAATLGAWWVAAWLELALSERYTSHYFAVVAVPMALMAALLLGWGYSALAARGTRPWDGVTVVLVTVAVSIYVAGFGHTQEALSRTIDFRGPAARVADAASNRDGETRTVGAVLDLVSAPGDPVLGWVMDPWPYLSFDRVSATRFVWRAFYIGEIYLADTSSKWVLPQTWEWFAEDVAESDPITLIEVRDRMAGGTPFARTAEAFAEVFDGELIRVSVRDDVLAILRTVSRTPLDTGDGTSAWITSEGSRVDETTGALAVGGTCRRFDATVSWDPDTAGRLEFRLLPDGSDGEVQILRLSRDSAVSGSNERDYRSVPVNTRSQTVVSLVVGARAAGLLADGRIVAAVPLGEPVTAFLDVVDGPIRISRATAGGMPVLTGCDA